MYSIFYNKLKWWINFFMYTLKMCQILQEISLSFYT